MTRAEIRVGERPAEWMVAWGALAIAVGGFLLALQVDANGAVAGTGYATLAIGALLALVVGLLRCGATLHVPRDATGALAAFALFLGLSFVYSGVLAPGGPWMFIEMLVLAWTAVAARSRDGASAETLAPRALWLLAALLVFRLWITYQGSEHRWELLSVSIPVVSWIPWKWLEPIQSVSLGSFTPHEFGFPPAGLDFPRTMSLWAAGFTACAAGILLAQHGWREHEHDRVHDVIHTLPPPLAALVDRLLPEDEWQRLGLFGLSERRLQKRIEALVAERMAREAEFQRAYSALAHLAISSAAGFEARVHEALLGHATIERSAAGARTVPVEESCP